ncbi:MAG: PDZ domain-containing protein, partial [Acidobacteria bacterium]|nr:PDZ domain-containing protein [Acidobacteriota bacterium]
LIVTSSFVLAFGQDDKKLPEKSEAPRAFSFAFEGGSYLGVQTQEITKDNFGKYSLSGVRGVAVEKVAENSPAAAAGIQAGDVILKFDGEDVTGVRKLTRLVGEVDPDHQVRITISRGGREQEITATVAKRPMQAFEDGNFTFPKMGEMPNMPQFKEMPNLKELPNMKELGPGEHVWTFPGGEGRSFVFRPGEGRVIGVGVEGLSKQLAQHYGVEGGVLVSEVREGSPAAKAGLQAGDIITEINGKAVKDQMDIIRSINDKKDGDVTVTFIRDGKRQTVNITPEKSKEGGFLFDTNDKDNGSLIGPEIKNMLGNMLAGLPQAFSLASWM